MTNINSPPPSPAPWHDRVPTIRELIDLINQAAEGELAPTEAEAKAMTEAAARLTEKAKSVDRLDRTFDLNRSRVA